MLCQLIELAPAATIAARRTCRPVRFESFAPAVAGMMARSRVLLFLTIRPLLLVGPAGASATVRNPRFDTHQQKALLDEQSRNAENRIVEAGCRHCDGNCVRRNGGMGHRREQTAGAAS